MGHIPRTGEIDCPSDHHHHLRHAEGQPLLACEQVVVGYTKPLLPPIDLTLTHGEICAIVGRNGSGKSTFLRTLLGLVPPLSGRLRAFCGGTLAMGYIPQRSELDRSAPLHVKDVVAMGVERGRSFARPWLSHNERERIQSAMLEMGVADMAREPFARLSEGQKQRVLMARLLASHPELAILDEPTAAMDEVAQRVTFELISKLRRAHGMTVVIVTHHLRAAEEIADTVAFLDGEEQQVVIGSPERVLTHPLFRARYAAVLGGV